MNLKIFSYIVSSIIGTGIFILPNTIIPHGWSAIISLIFSSTIFCGLGYILSNSNRPFEDMYEQIPNTKLNNIVALGYWVISWSSTIVIFYEMAQPLYYLIFSRAPTQLGIIIIQIFLTLLFMGIQLLGTNRINKIEIILTVCKILSAVIIPIMFIVHYFQNTITSTIEPVSLLGIFNTFPSIMWMFLGIECCSVIQGNKKISSMIYAISTVSVIYLLNFLAVLLTMKTGETYQDVMNIIFNGISGRVIMSIIIVILCFGSSNSWFTASTVTLQALADRGTVSNKFLSYNKAMFATSIGLIPLSILVSNPNAKVVFSNILDGFSIVTGIFYIFIAYAISKKYNKKIIGYTVIFIILIFTAYNSFTVFSKIFESIKNIILN